MRSTMRRNPDRRSCDTLSHGMCVRQLDADGHFAAWLTMPICVRVSMRLAHGETVSSVLLLHSYRVCRPVCVCTTSVLRYSAVAVWSMVARARQSDRTSAMMRPGRSLSTMMRSARNTASGMLCVTMNTVMACIAVYTQQLQVHALSGQTHRGQPNGSSISSNLGCCISVRARTTRCAIPPERCLG